MPDRKIQDLADVRKQSRTSDIRRYSKKHIVKNGSKVQKDIDIVRYSKQDIVYIVRFK